MAVYQISRIQIRRGQANQGTGLPQLASGEMAWAIDTQELYIGNGSVSEGAPAVGNTRLLTSNDLSSQAGLINSIYYTYQVTNTAIQTGFTANNPVSRSLQARLDDSPVPLTDFITQADTTSGDYTQAIQRAINQLFLNPNNGLASATVANRVKLFIPAGTYKTSGTLYIPSYATIEGAGVDKTIINYAPSLSVTGTTTNNSQIIQTTTTTLAMLGAYISGTNIPANTAIPGQISIPNSTITGTTLTVGTLASGTITPGMMLFGSGILPNTYIVANISGLGSGSTWTVNKTYATTTPLNQPVTGTGVVVSGSFTGNIVPGTGQYLGSGVLSTTSIASGSVQIGQLLTGTGIAANTYVTGNINATSWLVSVSQTVVSTTITGTGYISITSPATGAGTNTFTLVTSGAAVDIVCVDSNNNPSIVSQTSSGNQPCAIALKGLTIQTATGSNTCLQLDAVKDSVFEDLRLVGGNAGTTASFDTLSTGIALNALSSLLTCENNLFKNIVFDHLTFGVYSYQDILNNIFDNCHVKNSYQGFTLGYDFYSQFIDTNYYISQNSVIGQNYGPRQTQIVNCKFYNIYKRAVFLGLGSGNTVQGAKLVSVGNNGGGPLGPTTPQIYFYSSGNAVENVYSDRTNVLNNNSYITSVYIPEVAGWATVNSFGVSNSITIAASASTITVGSFVLGQLYTIASLGTTTNDQWNTIAGTSGITYLVGSQFTCANVGTGLGNGTVYAPTFAFRLPLATDEAGNPNGSAVYTIDYSYVSTANNFVRRGTITISSDIHNIGGTTYIYPLQLSDEYDFGGADVAYANSLKLDFSAVYLDTSGTVGAVYNSAQTNPPSSIQIQYNNLLSGDTGSFTYTYSVIFTKPY